MEAPPRVFVPGNMATARLQPMENMITPLSSLSSYRVYYDDLSYRYFLLFNTLHTQLSSTWIRKI